MRVGMILVSACLATTASAQRVEKVDRRAAEYDRLMTGRVAGEPRSCLPEGQTRQSTIYRGAIVYRVSRDTVYRNDMNGCSDLRFDTYPVFRIYSGQLCRGDIVQIVDRGNGMAAGGCTVGSFVPYTRVPR